MLKKLCLGDPRDFKKSGVYKITHIKYPQRLYIGSTAVSSYHSGLYRRWWRHFYELRTKTHCNIKLQRVVNKYGLEGLRFEIIEICEPEKTIVKEQFWIDKLDPYYNIVKIAGKTTGYKHTDDYISRRSKPVLQYSLEGNFIREFGSAKEASKSTNILRDAIRNSCTGKTKMSGGFQWKYKVSECFETTIPKYIDTVSLKLICYDSNGVFVDVFDSMLSASTALGMPVGNISKHLSDNTSSCYGYTFRRFKKNFPLNIILKKRRHTNQISVKILNLETKELLFFDSLREAHNNGFDRSRFFHYIKKGIFEYTFKKKYKINIIKN